jgi:hypothetical protein
MFVTVNKRTVFAQDLYEQVTRFSRIHCALFSHVFNVVHKSTRVDQDCGRLSLQLHLNAPKDDPAETFLYNFTLQNFTQTC